MSVNLPKYRELKEDELLEINDIVVVEYRGKSKYVITRVTKTQAICKYDRSTENNPNDFIDIKFTRKYGFWFSFVPRDTWDKNHYKVYREIK